ncbi:MAG TPA: hypothetical protein VJB66_05670 [Candidatus Nanoarchaeia archaeon]|nr:hypothetical protein [Candidatus Nanoarchaeia archaeon]
MNNIEKIIYDGNVLAIVVRHDFVPDKLSFPTPENFALQLGIHHRQKNDTVEAHGHVPFENVTIPAQEFFYVVSGKVDVDIYHQRKKHSTVVLAAGDMILLNCVHAMKFAENSRIVEIKQGPYRGKENEKEFM